MKADGSNKGGITYNSEGYDTETTQKLVDMLEVNPYVTRIIFNDPKKNE